MPQGTAIKQKIKLTINLNKVHLNFRVLNNIQPQVSLPLEKKIHRDVNYTSIKTNNDKNELFKSKKPGGTYIEVPC